MATYAFCNIPAWGHVNPTLAVAEELVRRGHNVSYYLTEEFRETIQATGATFEPYEAVEGGGGPRFSTVPPAVIDRLRTLSPDVILYDFMCGWAKPLIEELQIPAIALRPTYASNEHFNSVQNMPGIQEFLARVKARFAAQGEYDEAAFLKNILSVFASFEQLNIMFIPRFFQPMEETFDERFVFVGPSILPRHQETPFPFEQLRDDLPLLYISMGSIATNHAEFYKQCFEAFGGQPWQVVLTVGKSTDTTQLGPIPDNFLLSPYVPQLDILPRTQVFVTHGGMNSVMESMYYGVPMVVIPQQPEQQMNGQRIVDLGLGALLDTNTVNDANLRAAVEQIAQNVEYRERAQALRQVTRDDGGYQRAADAIIQFTEK
jgi:MGT family glycosyltransferase